MQSKSGNTQTGNLRFCFRAFLFLLPFVVRRSSSQYADGHRLVSTWMSPMRINSIAGLLEYAEDSCIHSMDEFHFSSIDNLNQNRKLWSNNDDNSTTTDGDDDDGVLSLLTFQFSLWYPTLHGKVTEHDEQSEYFLLAVLAVLRDFFCQHVSHVVVVHPTNHSQSLCLSVGNITDDLDMFAYANETIRSSTGFDILLTFGTMLVSQQREGNIDWMSWAVTYQVVHAGELATPMQIHEDFTLESTIQSVLERSIKRGALNKGLRDYLDSSLPTFSIVGQEMETFQESFMALLEHYDFSADAFLLQQIGIALLILVVCIYIMLTGAARNHRLLRERQRILEGRRREYYREEVRRSSTRKSGGHQTILGDVVLLETEDDVNLMLAVGREESLKKFRLSGGAQPSGRGPLA